MIFSKRTNGLSSAIFSILENKKKELIDENREVFDFGTGTPDIPPAPHIIKTMEEAVIRPENHKYAIKDLPELIEAVMEWYLRRYGVHLERDEIISLAGSQDGLAHISLILADTHDTVLVPDPGYPIFSIGPSLAGADIYKLPLLRENNYIIDLDAISATIAHKSKIIIVSYPNNPVTAVAPDVFYEKLIWFAKKYDIVVVHDNAYSELVYDGKTGGSFLKFPGAKEVGVEFNSLSKSYNLTGSRISFALGNRKIIEQLKNLKSHLDYGIFLPVQKAAIAAITGPQDYLRSTVETYQKRRNTLVDGFNSLGWNMNKPPATMFVWSSIPKGYSSSMEFCMELIDRYGIITVPGSSFGDGGEGFVRLALVQPEEKIKRAINLIKGVSKNSLIKFI
ncbi:MAG: aminotransferase class I/II-fold pyridoxal phosphate-dependent enzyme [Bacillota bacterium]|nr:aminotransferase class I/II-fold pyridoxal phosphate-dependent enzyme [Bacillota bacterium]